MGVYVPGRFYTVPTVEAAWTDLPPRVWVIMGPWHSDAEFFDFEDFHYHLDPQFVPWRIWDRDERAIWTAPIHDRPLPSYWGPPFNVGPVVMRRRKCLREMPPHLINNLNYRPRASREMNAAYAGTRINPDRPVCPHRGADLSRVPIRGGCRECPLHGLRFNAATGEIVDGWE